MMMALREALKPGFIAVAFLLVTGEQAVVAAPVAYATLDPNAYQAFVGNWTPSNAPLCAAIASRSAWDEVIHPAPVMGGSHPFAPPDDFWKTHAILLLAHVVGAGDARDVYKVLSVTRAGDGVDVTYRFRPTPPASSTMKWWMAVAVRKPLPSRVRFTSDGQVVCTIAPDTIRWISPARIGKTE